MFQRFSRTGLINRWFLKTDSSTVRESGISTHQICISFRSLSNVVLQAVKAVVWPDDLGVPCACPEK